MNIKAILMMKEALGLCIPEEMTSAVFYIRQVRRPMKYIKWLKKKYERRRS
jgi:hypothetical protein